MDIKSKKFDPYNHKNKKIIISTIILASIVNYFSLISTLKIFHDWDWNILNTENVYETSEFHKILTTTLDNVILLDLYYQNEQHIINGNFIDNEEMFDGFKKYYGIVDNFITENTIIDLDGQLISPEYIPSSLEDVYEQYVYLLENKLPIYRAIYIQKQIDEYQATKSYLQLLSNFYYCIESPDGNFFSGNSYLDDIINLERHIIFYNNKIINELSNEPFIYENQYLTDLGFKLYVGIREPLFNSGLFFKISTEYDIAKANLPMLAIFIFLTSIAIVLGVAILVRVAGQEKSNGKVTYLKLDRIYNDIHFIFTFVILLIIISFSIFLYNQMFYYTDIFWNNIFMLILCCMYVITTSVIISYTTSVSRHIKDGHFLKNTIICKIFNAIEKNSSSKDFRKWIIIRFMLYSIINGLLMHYIINAFTDNYMLLFCSFLGIFLIYNSLFFIWFIKLIMSLQLIMITVKEASLKNFDYVIPHDNISITFYDFYQDVINIQNLFKSVSAEATKSENMKTELIANVSHDLKTPLTSIISYVGILKNIEVGAEDHKKYVKILYDKSHRLKQLIDDLMEASRVSSGTLTMTPIVLNFRQICLQCIGEMEDKIHESGIELVMNSNQDLLIYADGRHLARVIENLISNALKYSAPNSRVCLDIFKKDNMAVLTMKNTSDLDLNFTKTQLVSRFFRGDDARSTDGTGLGLSIAESLTELQNGTFDIQIEGVYFKAIVTMPLQSDEN